MRNYKNIEVWQLAKELTVSIYKASKSFPREELFGLTSQMRRSSVSVAANIAEGSSRKSNPDYLRFLSIAMGSLKELCFYIDLSLELGYLKNEVSLSLAEKGDKTAAKLFRLMKAVEAQD